MLWWEFIYMILTCYNENWQYMEWKQYPGAYSLFPNQAETFTIMTGPFLVMISLQIQIHLIHFITEFRTYKNIECNYSSIGSSVKPTLKIGYSWVIPSQRWTTYFGPWYNSSKSLRWHHNGCDSVSNHQPHDCLLNPLFRRKWKKTSKLHFTGLCAGNSPGTGEFPAQMASNAENVSFWWCHHVILHHDYIDWSNYKRQDKNISRQMYDNATVINWNLILWHDNRCHHNIQISIEKQQCSLGAKYVMLHSWILHKFTNIPFTLSSRAC